MACYDFNGSGAVDIEAILTQEALPRDPYLGATHLNLGIVYLRTGRPAEAADELALAARYAPPGPGAEPLLVEALARAGRGEEALARFTSTFLSPRPRPGPRWLSNCWPARIWCLRKLPSRGPSS